MKDYQEINRYPSTFPEYNDIVIPPNIAPLNFQVREPGKKFIVSIHFNNEYNMNIKSNSSVIQFRQKKWKKLLQKSKGRELTMEIFVMDSTRKWLQYKPLILNVAREEIDSYLTYRLINVGYVLYRKMGTYQRNLTNFNERPIMLNRNTKGNCINCHSYCKNDPEKMVFHLRGSVSGTIISSDNDVINIDTKTPYTMSPGVYPSWHPEGQHIAFSVDIVNQWFHGVEKRNEVFDRASDLVIYSLKTNTLTTSPAVSTKNRETLPCWSPDGKYLYYCSAPETSDTLEYDEVKYDLVRIPYNTVTNEWGKADTILRSSSFGKSITFPKISPDGRYLMICLASHGYFTIYNKTSELYLLNLETNETYPFPFNSNDVDSYHSWSHNGRWIVFSSKRIDGLCARLFISYFDENGKFGRPFVLPQKNPRFYDTFISNYNVPELVTGSVVLNRNKLLKAAAGGSEPVKFDETVEVDALSGATRFEQVLIR
ncbi:MAG: PD40 domain-containing protein [Bacteroidales bacterium]|nr:PD40 domain-containing protein [Bacteroidales bacterium]